MKLTNRFMVVSAAIGLTFSAQAQVSVLSSGAGPLGFPGPTAPTVADGWSTLSVGTDAATISNATQLATAVQLLNATAITTPLGSSTSDPSTANAIARWNGARMRLQTKPTGVDYLVLMATLRNDTGQDITSFDVSYLYAVDPAGVEQIPGHRAFYSVSGAPGSWLPLGVFSGVTADGTLTTAIAPSGWSPGQNLHLLWADDNAEGGTEGGYTIDEFTVANVITTVLPVSIAITSPTNSQQVVQGVTVNVTTATTGPILNVDFRVDGGSVNVDSTPPFGFALATAGLSVGMHTLQGIASDGTTQTPSAIVNFQVLANGPPTIVITNLAAPTNFLVGTAIPVNGRILDDVAVTNVDWFVDGSFYVTRAGVGNLGFTYVNSLAGSHSIHGVATDSTGQQTTSASVTVGVTNPPAAIFTLLLTNGSAWKYFNDTSEPVDPSGFAQWYEIFFTDDTWASGLAELGGGDRADGYPEKTLINIGTNQPRFLSIYFRKTFTVSDPALYPNVVLRLLRDDGAVVYLNNQPVWTNNMATTDLDPVTGNIAYTNQALASDDGLTYQVLNISSNLLFAGDNFISVEVHQQNTNSSDLSFDMMVWGERATAPMLTITSPTNGQSFPAGVNVTANVTASTFVTNATLLVDGAPVGTDDTRPFSIVASNLSLGTHTLVARGRDQFGASGDSPPVTITIVANQPPTVSLTNPPTNIQLLVGSSVTLGAQAADSDGTVTRVEFYDNGTLINTDTTVTYSRDEVDLTAGTHVFTAVAVDNGGQSTVSAPLTVTVTNPPNVTVLLTNRSEWKWAAITNADFGSAWVNLGFNDSAWNTGSGKFGFGDDGEKTVIGVTNIPSFYFRKVLTVADPSVFGAIIIAAIRDDGLIVHVNGNPVFIDRITGTPPIPFDTLADSPAVGGADENRYFLSTNTSSIFVPGPNIIAVEVHQQSLTSSDVGFDLMIFGTAPGCPNPQVVRNSLTGQVTISWTGSGQLYSSADVVGPYTTLASATSPFSFTPSGATRFFRVRCQ